MIEGPDAHGIDRGIGNARTGNNNAWIRDSTSNWNAITQWITVTSNTDYTLIGWIRDNFTDNIGYFGVRNADGVTVLKETSFGPSAGYIKLAINFSSGSNSLLKIYAGFWGQNHDLWLQIDDISVYVSHFPQQSTVFSTSAEEAYATYQMLGDGDLWPSCWANDDNVYAANGDGSAFTSNPSRFDIAVSRISGMPPHLTGVTVATHVGTNWSGGSYNRKPTGMACVGAAIYLAFQNLNWQTFNDAPAASIAKSTDHGQTWTWDTSAPMFGAPGNTASPEAYLFTTIMFLDFGKDSANAIDEYTYAYGLDYTWRGANAVYLGRVPSNRIQDRSAWTFYAGTDEDEQPLWTSDITAKVAVPQDDRLLYPVVFGENCGPSNQPNQPVIGQGGVVYDAPLHRYLMTSWSCTTHEFYEAPEPWGPWRLFQSNDFTNGGGLYNHGQYGTAIPSKYISEDGQSVWIQSNVCCLGDSYTFSLRHVYVTQFVPALALNLLSDTNNLASPIHAPRAISKSSHFGVLCGPNCSDILNDGVTTNQSDDDWDLETKPIDWWGYTWPSAHVMNRAVYTTGKMFPDGGWYASNLRVQVRQFFQWIDVEGLTITPPYPYSDAAGTNQTYVLTFRPTWGDGLRIIGSPGGKGYFTSIAELSVYFSVDSH
jgi:hypothetical protein